MAYENLTDVLTKDVPLVKGQRVRLRFQASSGKWRRATQIAIIEWRLKKVKDLEIIRSNDLGTSEVVFEIEIKDIEELWTEKKIIEHLIAANPAGFTLIFKESAKAVAETVKEAAKITVDIGKYVALALVGVGLIYLAKGR